MKQFLLSALAVLVISGAWAQELKKSPKGSSFKIVKHGDGRQIKTGDVITFHFVQKTAKDSVLMSSYTQGTPVKIQTTESQNIADLMDVFPMLSEKDSAVIYLPTDSIFKGYEDRRPPFLPAGSNITFSINILQVQTVEEAMAESQKKIDSLKAMEKTTLAAYLADKKLPLTTTASGLMYAVTTPSTGIKPAKGDTLLVNYIGATLDGNVFDTSIQSEATKAGLEQPGRAYEPIRLVVGNGEVIPGWDEGLLLFNQGSKGTLIIPSDLAYGEQGGGEVIKPFSTLRFDVELVKVIKPKPVAAPAPAATPVKKPTATPVKKPAATTVKKPAAATTPAKTGAAPAKTAPKTSTPAKAAPAKK